MWHGSMASHTQVWPPVPVWPLLIQIPAGFHLQGRGPCSRRSPTARCKFPDRRSGVMVGLTLECPSHQSPPPNYGHTLILLYPQISKLVPPNLVTFSPSLESDEERELERERESWKERWTEKHRDNRWARQNRKAMDHSRTRQSRKGKLNGRIFKKNALVVPDPCDGRGACRAPGLVVGSSSVVTYLSRICPC